MATIGPEASSRARKAAAALSATVRAAQPSSPAQLMLLQMSIYYCFFSTKHQFTENTPRKCLRRWGLPNSEHASSPSM